MKRNPLDTSSQSFVISFGQRLPPEEESTGCSCQVLVASLLCGQVNYVIVIKSGQWYISWRGAHGPLVPSYWWHQYYKVMRPWQVSNYQWSTVIRAGAYLALGEKSKSHSSQLWLTSLLNDQVNSASFRHLFGIRIFS